MPSSLESRLFCHFLTNLRNSEEEVKAKEVVFDQTGSADNRVAWHHA